jgi:hypothetical protein
MLIDDMFNYWNLYSGTQAIKEVPNMAFDAYIKNQGIPGDSLDDQHKGGIEVSGYGGWDCIARKMHVSGQRHV